MTTYQDILAAISDTALGSLVSLVIESGKLPDMIQRAAALGLQAPRNNALFYRESSEYVARALIAVNTLGE